MVAVLRTNPINDGWETATSCTDCYAIGTNQRKEKVCAVIGAVIPDPDEIPDWCPCEKVN
jgi:hypothetical protein